jgi:regulator of protease activity HflC (stomatin/prohibitin superfamily)
MAEGDGEPEPEPAPPRPVRWKQAARLSALALLPLFAGLSITVIPSGYAGVRVSQISGARPGTLYPGVHALLPLVEDVALYSTRDAVYSTGAIAETRDATQKDETRKGPELLHAQTNDGLSVGFAVTVRYRIDPAKLYWVHTTMPPDIAGEVVAPVVGSAFRERSPVYSMRELATSKREELRLAAAESIAKHLASDGIVVKEVLLRDVQPPFEYSRGLEALLLKEQENGRLTVELQAKEKEVRIAQMEAESQKGIMIKNAEGSAQSKVLDSRAELERLKLMAEAEENRIRRVASANSEKMKLEAAVLKDNPLLIQKIIAERLSDKVQIMMVPADVKNFFAGDVLRGALGPLGR